MAGTTAMQHSSGSNTFAWTLNVSTSVLIVFANKVLLSANGGHGFTFATTLCALHFVACAGSIWVAQNLGFAAKARIPVKDALKFAVVASISIASLNLSLLVNSIGFYQVAKLLITPCTCLMEMLAAEKTVTPGVATSIAMVVAGVAVVTVNDVQVNLLGLAIAVVSVVSSGMQQIMCGNLQRKHRLSSYQLLANIAYIQGIMLLVIGPFIDQAVSQQWITQYAWSSAALQQLLLSCGLAVLVNVSQFMCLGRFSAVTFQVLGHTKTIVVLLASWWVFQEQMTVRKLAGMGLAVMGMVLYGWLGSRTAAKATGQADARGGKAGGRAGAARRSPHSRRVGKQAVTSDAAGVEGGRVIASHPIRLTEDGHGQMDRGVRTSSSVMVVLLLALFGDAEPSRLDCAA
ncbi:triose-phosphate transporter family-domain-containing protein [Scenedesmus sp. NREL 46B-D3]|nr:triose-phosphate transporter family-domain-containing protein [Scenedesmus sp. NREL 46B-D3]